MPSVDAFMWSSGRKSDPGPQSKFLMDMRLHGQDVTTLSDTGDDMLIHVRNKYLHLSCQ